jgi:hypothetical protein
MLVSLASRAEGPALLLLPFDNATGEVRYDALVAGMPDILSACLSEFPDHVVVVDRAVVEPLLREQGLAVEAYTEPGRQQGIGALIGADFVVRGSLTLSDGQLHAELLAFNVKTATLAHTERAKLRPASIIEDVCAKLAPSLAARLAEMPSARATVHAAEPEEQLLLMRGLKSYYTGGYVEALAPFLKLIRLNAEDEAAHFWLARSFAGAGLTDYARVQFKDFLIRFPGSARTDEVRQLLTRVTAADQPKE